MDTTELPTPPQPRTVTRTATRATPLSSRKLAAVAAAGGLTFLDKLQSDQLCTVLIVDLIAQACVDCVERIADALAHR